MSPRTKVRSPFTVTKFTFHEDERYYSARVTIDGETREFHTRFGSWLTDEGEGRMLEASAEVRDLLASKMPKRKQKTDPETPDDNQEDAA